jgi:hypothetical protein
MLGEEPYLQFVSANHLAHQQIVGAVVSCVRRLLGYGAGFLQDNFVSFQQAGDLHRSFFPAARWTRNESSLRDVGRHGDADAAQKLDAFRDGVHQFGLLFEMFVKEQM